LPFGHGKQFGHDLNPALNAVLGNWEIGGIVTLHTGNCPHPQQLRRLEWRWAETQTTPTVLIPQTLAGLPDCNGAVHDPQ
jgi:hypothetical protein